MAGTKDYYEKALIAPEEVFAAPMDIVTDPALSPVQKLRLLKHWEANSHDLLVASEEGMTGPGRARLGEVKKAIIKLCELENLDEHSVR